MQRVLLPVGVGRGAHAVWAMMIIMFRYTGGEQLRHHQHTHAQTQATASRHTSIPSRAQHAADIIHTAVLLIALAVCAEEPPKPPQQVYKGSSSSFQLHLTCTCATQKAPCVSDLHGRWLAVQCARAAGWCRHVVRAAMLSAALPKCSGFCADTTST